MGARVRRLLVSSFASPDPRTRTTAWVTCGLFVATCVVAAGLGGLLGVPGPHRVVVPAPASAEAAAPTTVVETRYVDDPYYVVGTTVAPAAPSDGVSLPVSAGSAGAVPAPAAAPTASGTTAAATATPSGGGGPSAGVAPSAVPSSSGSADDDDEAAPTPTAPSTVAPAPTTTLPAGARIPDDWPPGKPIPPIPPGCRKPVLEDDGRWNCDH